MKIRKMYFIGVLFFSFINMYSQSNCETSFQSLGFVECTPLIEKSSLLDHCEVSQKTYKGYQYYMLVKNETILGIQKKVTYTFIFDNEKLINYSFKLKDRKSFFIALRDSIIKSKKSTFINLDSKSKFRFKEVNKKCRKYFKPVHMGEKFYIVGGVEILTTTTHQAKPQQKGSKGGNN